MRFQGKNIFNACFDVFAKNYHNVRPGYPGQMYKDIKQICDITEKSKLLEIGTGSGIATTKLAKFGCKIMGIEPGANLAKIAKQQVAKNTNIEIKEEMFETFKAVENFDAILSFTAFHWINEEEKYQKVYDLLKKDGNLVLVWNSFLQCNLPVAHEVNKVYQKLLPDVYKKGNQSVNEAVLEKLKSREKEMHENNLFSMYFLKKYLTVYNYSPQTYQKLLNTYPKIIEIDEGRRKKFLSEIGMAVKKYDKIPVPVLTTLIICKRKDFLLNYI